jgi:hypothetical protein
MSIVPPDEEPLLPAPSKNRAAAELGRRGGIKGGAMRAARMTPEERAQAARFAATARWARLQPADDRPPSVIRNRDGEPFSFDLTPDEIAAITTTPVAGKGGLQSLQKRLREQLAVGSTVQFNNADLGQLIRYMTRYPSGGGFQNRLREAFDRSLKTLLGY